MKHEDLVALAKQAGFNGDERIYDWCYTYHTSREFDDSYKQAFRLDITPEMLKFGLLVAEAEREACAKVCDSRFVGDHNREDAEARRCAEAIRARGRA